jgi:hypothetical protein
MRETTGAEDLDDGFRLGWMMRGFGGERIRRGLRVVQHSGERDAAKTAAEFPEKITTGDGALLPMAGKGCVHGFSRGKQIRWRS